jgi:hypothetical protein
VSTSLTAGTDYSSRRSLWIWEAASRYEINDVILYSNNMYKVLVTHVSSSVSADLTSGNLVRLSTKKVSATYYDIGPFTSQGGYSGNIDTGAQYINLATNEVVIAYRPTASNADNGGWSDGGRATVRFGFALRIARINKQ